MYKTIVVHVSSAPGMRATLSVASDLSARMGAHLVGAAASGVVELNYLMTAGAPMAMAALPDGAQLRADAESDLRAFRRHCEASGVVSCETRMFDTSAADALLLQSRYCDLLVAGTEDVSVHGLLMPARLPDTLVTQAARPVLLVPPALPADAAFDNIMVAWNGSLGISRVIAFALPLIRRATRVYVAVCNAAEDRIDTGGEPGADVAAYLARHHHNVELIQRATGDSTDRALLKLADETDTRLLLAGAFGHSRLHDWVLGSTTRGLLAQSRIPVLMTH